MQFLAGLENGAHHLGEIAQLIAREQHADFRGRFIGVLEIAVAEPRLEQRRGLGALDAAQVSELHGASDQLQILLDRLRQRRRRGLRFRRRRLVGPRNRLTGGGIFHLGNDRLHKRIDTVAEGRNRAGVDRVIERLSDNRVFR